MYLKIIYSLDQIDSIVQQIKTIMQNCSIITLSGSLGTGKTTLVRALLRACGITSHITSPTFTYVNCYRNEKGEHFYHFDLYRIANQQEFQQYGFEEYLYQPNSWSIIEWPEVIAPLLKHNVCTIILSDIDMHQRQAEIIWDCHG